ncbi:MAG: lactate utilization protein [Chloroflexi bacterium]|nr:lactate utilization protein [Chloroflexota bacterium]
MNDEIQTVIQSLVKNEFDVRYAENSDAARQIILDMIPDGGVVGVGDSVTVRQLGVFEALQQRGTPVINPWASEEKPLTWAEVFDMIRKTRDSDVFLTGSNAVTRDGKIVNTDMTGNRVSAMIYGVPLVILAIGRNKITKDVAQALDRLKNIVAPEHCQTKARKTPCAVTGRCTDCNSAQRICRVTTIMEKRPFQTDIKVVMIDQDLGLSWNPDWDRDRIEAIKRNYKALTRPRRLPD